MANTLPHRRSWCSLKFLSQYPLHVRSMAHKSVELLGVLEKLSSLLGATELAKNINHCTTVQLKHVEIHEIFLITHFFVFMCFTVCSLTFVS